MPLKILVCLLKNQSTNNNIITFLTKFIKSFLFQKMDLAKGMLSFKNMYGFERIKYTGRIQEENPFYIVFVHIYVFICMM